MGAPPRPHIVLVCVDQMRGDAWGRGGCALGGHDLAARPEHAEEHARL